MIRINYEGRLGNQLFQYAHAVIDSIESGEGIENPLSSLIVKYRENTDDNPIRIQHGYFQSPEIVQKLYAYRDTVFHNVEEKDGVFVHIRLGDIAHRSNIIPSLEFYRMALLSCSFNEGFISSDSPSHPMVEILSRQFNLNIIQGGAEDTILFGAQFKNKVLSLGTFSWWIGFLGSQNNIIHPKQSNYDIWHGNIFCVENWQELDIK